MRSECGYAPSYKASTSAVRCSECCTECGTCKYCLDRPLVGGRNVFRKPCVQRGCLMLLGLTMVNHAALYTTAGGTELVAVAAHARAAPVAERRQAAGATWAPAGLWHWLVASVYGGEACGVLPVSPPPSPTGGDASDDATQLTLQALRQLRQTATVTAARGRWEQLQERLAADEQPRGMLEARARRATSGQADAAPGVNAQLAASVGVRGSAGTAPVASARPAAPVGARVATTNAGGVVARALLGARSKPAQGHSAPSAGGSAHSQSWAAAGHKEAMLLPQPDAPGEAAAWRRANGLTVMPNDPVGRAAAVAQTQGYLRRGYADSTNHKDEGHWLAWTAVHWRITRPSTMYRATSSTRATLAVTSQSVAWGARSARSNAPEGRGGGTT